MKTMIISDIHGYSYNLKKVLNIYHQTNCERLIILGDLSTPGSDSKEVINLLDRLAPHIICMEGNNDYYLFNSFKFNIIKGYLNIKLDKNNVYITHGDRYNRYNINLSTGDILLSGHTHVACLLKDNNKYYMNPGSISLPRDNTNGSYIIYENNKFSLFDIDNGLINEMTID